METNKAEELAREYAYKCHQEFEPSSYLATDFIAGYNSRQSEIDELTKDVERLKALNTRLFTLWDSLAEIGEIHIGARFSSTYDKLKEDNL